MNYKQLRNSAISGDVLGVKGDGFFSKIVKFFTKEKYSHVAMLVWHGTGLWVYEFVEGRGYQCMPASQWLELRNGQKIYFGRGPNEMTNNEECIIKSTGSFRVSEIKQHYGIISLVKVVLSQWTGKKINVYFKVCSTFIQHVWEECGFKMDTTADPGDIMRVSKANGAIDKIEQ